MKKRKWLIGLCLAAVLALCGAFAACGGGEEPGPDDGGGSDLTEVWDLELVGEKTRTLEIDETITDPVTDTLTWTVTKDGEAVTTETVTVTLSGDSVTYDEASHKVTAVKVGKTTVTLTLTGHTDALPVSVTYEVVDYFFSREVQRGTLNFSGESAGQVRIMGGQATLVAERKATAWVFRTTLSAVDYNTGEAFGIGSFLDNGDHALWFGMQNTDSQPDGKFSILQKDYYAGWAGTDTFPEGYGNRKFDLTKGVACEIIRNGNDYYYTIGTYYGTYTAQETEATYPGVFSQERVVTVSDFSVSYDADEVSAAAATYATKGVASVVINETQKNRLIKGSTQQYTANCYPADKSAGVTVAWSLETDEMTAGKEGTTIDTDGTLHLSDNAAGKVTVVCTAGEAKDTLTVTIIAASEDKSNDQLSVKGGVILEDSGDIVFPDYMASTNGIGDEQRYQDTAYGATLNEAVQGNFSIEFTVSEYVAYAQNPKLMISLGGDHNQFYVVYTAGYCRIETYTRHVYDNAVHDNDWVNSDNFTGFDASASHIFKIEVRNGIYNVKVDGTPLTFTPFSGGNGGPEATLVRSYEHCASELPVRISTNGVSARVSDIKVQSGSPLPDYFHFGNATTIENGIEMQCYNGSSDAAAWAQARTRVIRTAANRTGDCNLTMNITFSAAMHDSKAIVLLGTTQELQFCNKIAAGEGIKLQLVDGSNFGQTYPVPCEAGAGGTYTIALRIERSGNSNRIIANGEEICRTEYAFGEHLQFSVFNMNADENSVTVKFTDIAFSDYEASDVYTIEDLTKDVPLSVGGQHEVTFTVHRNGTPMHDEDYTVEVTTEEKNFISYDEGSKKVTALAAGEETLTITIKVEGEVVCTATVTFHVSARETLTENENWTVKGGVVLYEDDNSIEFTVANQGTNGVGDEGSYQDNDYSANYKKTVKGDFSIEFTVENYKSVGDYPKLMISLGGTHNQFYVAYNRLGRINRVESFTESLSGNSWYDGGWINSAEFASFNVNASHTYKIEVKNGVYTVSLDGKPLTFHEGENLNDVRTPVRKLADYATELPIRISTSGVSCTVRNIKVETTPTTIPDYFSYGDKAQPEENGVAMEFTTGTWDQARNRVVRKEPIQNGDFTLTMNITFSAALTDAKAIVNLGGSKEFHFCNKIKTGQLYLELVNMNGEYIAWPAVADYNIPYEAGEDGTYTIALRIERSGNINRIIANGVELCRPEYEIGSYLRFSVFNENAGEADATVKFTDITFGEYEELDIYTIEDLNRKVTISKGKEQELTYTVYRNGTPIHEGYTVEVATEEKEFISYDEASKKIKALKAGEENVTITIKVNGDVVCTAVVQVTVSERPTATENSDWTVKGGVVLYTDDNSIEFPEAYQSTNGVGDDNGEKNYTDNEYSAVYKHKVIGNFSIKFTVSNYKTNGAQYPKLMISLGGVNNQFYVVYNREGTINRIETFTKSIDASGNMCGGQWVNSSEFAEFDTNAPHTFEIKVVSGGLYEVYLDDNKVEGFSESGNLRTIFRRYEDYTTEQPIRISTNGVSCTLSDIEVTNGSAEDVKTSGTENANWFTHSDKHISAITDGGFAMSFARYAWTARDDYKNRIFYTGTIAQYFTAEFDLVISDWMTDTKFVATFGNYHVMIDIKGNVIKCNVAPGGDDWNENDIPEATVGSTIHIKVVNAEDGFKVYSGTSGENLIHTKAAATTVSPLSFWAYCNEDGRDSVTATVSNLTVS